MKAFYTDRFTIPLPVGHRFPILKYSLLKQKLLADQCPKIELLEPEAASPVQLRCAHSPEYLEKVFSGQLSEKEQRRTGFPWSPELVERSRRSVGATLAACRAALQEGLAANLGGGTHHAYPDHGEGYCVFNDVAVAVRSLQAGGLLRKVLLVDCDAHQGNGNAAIFSGDETVYTFDLYGAKNFPFHKEQPTLGIALPDGTGDQVYLETLEEGLWRSLALFSPQLVIYLAGADPYQHDRLGRLGLTMKGLENRDHLVLRTLREHELPVVVVMAGGYAWDIAETAHIQARTVEIAAEYS